MQYRLAGPGVADRTAESETRAEAETEAAQTAAAPCPAALVTMTMPALTWTGPGAAGVVAAADVPDGEAEASPERDVVTGDAVSPVNPESRSTDQNSLIRFASTDVRMRKPGLRLHQPQRGMSGRPLRGKGSRGQRGCKPT